MFSFFGSVARVDVNAALWHLFLLFWCFWALPVSRTKGNQRLDVSSRTAFIRRADGQNMLEM
jgi:hypothetical protein